MEDIGRLVVAQSFLYSLALLTIALTIAIILDLFRIRSLPSGLRTYVYGTFFVGILALMLSYGQDIIKTPSQLQSEVDKKVAKTTDENITLAQQRASVVELASGASPPQETPAGQTPLANATLYIQVASSEQKLESKDFVSALGKLGVKTPGIEIVGSRRAPPAPEVRFFNKADASAAQKIAELANANGLSGAAPRSMTDWSAKTGVLEFWYPR